MSKNRSAKFSVAIVLVASAAFSVSARAGVVNGDFSAGNTGFTSGYGFASASDPGGGHYTVGTNPHTWNSALSSFGDHTTGTGQMLVADGSGTANTTLWSESLTVTPNSLYTFTYWAASCGNDNNNGIDPSPAILHAADNGTAIGSNFSVPATNGVWTKFTGTFNSGANTSVTLTITDTNTNGGAGNDFALDDISLVPEPASLTLLVLALVSGWAFLHSQRRATAVAPV